MITATWRGKLAWASEESIELVEFICVLGALLDAGCWMLGILRRTSAVGGFNGLRE
jgi:hypothetical protein